MTKRYLITSILCTSILLAGLTGCGSKDDKEAEKPPESAEKLYTNARQEFSEGKYKAAVKDFEEVERQHPSSEWAMNAQVMSGFASYRAADYDTAVATLQRFVKLYPNNDSTPYAYYLIAICYYEQITDVGRDQKVTEQAMEALREIIRRFPDTEYARDAKVKLDLTQDHLAGKEMQVGRYYQRHDNYVAAINRFRYVIESFQTTSHVPEALHRLVECYLRLGVTDEAQRYAAVLGYNFPGSIWYRDSYALLNGGAKPREDMEEVAAREEEEKKEQDAENAKHASELKEPPADKFGIIRREAEPAPVGAVEDVTNKPADAPDAEKPAEKSTEKPAEKKDEGSSWWPFGSDDKTAEPAKQEAAKPEEKATQEHEAPAAPVVLDKPDTKAEETPAEKLAEKPIEKATDKKEEGSSWWPFDSDEKKTEPAKKDAPKAEEKPAEKTADKKEEGSSWWPFDSDDKITEPAKQEAPKPDVKTEEKPAGNAEKKEDSSSKDSSMWNHLVPW